MNKVKETKAAINETSRISRIVVALGLMTAVLIGYPQFGFGIFAVSVASIYLAMTAITGLDPFHGLLRAATHHDEIPSDVAHQP
jgi:hypothetical protein